MNSATRPSAKPALKCRSKIGNYFVRKKLAEGTFGIVYEAGSEFSNKTFAIKELFVDDLCMRSEDGNTVETDECNRLEFASYKDDFVREAEELHRLNHKNIVVEHDLIRDLNGTSYLVMENLEGGTLEDRIENAARGIDYEDLKPVILGILDALEEIHAKGIVHRDVKPVNIGFRKPDHWSPVLMDFGISCRSMQPKCTSGTPPYSPLDQDSDTDEDHKEWNDIYAFGATLFHCITGIQPPTAKQRHIDRSKRKADTVKKEIFSSKSKSLGYPKNVLQIIFQMMSLSADKRGTAADIKRKITSGFPRKGPILLILVSAVILLASLVYLDRQDRITLENYNRVSMGMGEERIIDVLGSPTECTDKFARKLCIWKKGEKYIEVTFVSSKATYFTANGLE